jgi:hypothetical protein
VNSDESMVERGPAGDAFLALIHAFEPVLQIVKGVIAEREASTVWDICNAQRHRERLEPLLEAYRLGKAAYERLESHGPEVADGAARLVATLYLSPLRMREDVRELAETLDTALRKLTEQPTAAPRDES